MANGTATNRQTDTRRDGGAGADADKTINCIDCGSDFLFTVNEQRFFRDKGFTNDPKRCHGCRSDRKMKVDRPRPEATERRGISYDAVCAQCGVQTTVPFYPTGRRPVYCRECFRGR